MNDTLRLLAAGTACLAFLATLSRSAQAGLPSCTSDQSCSDGGVCVGLDGGWGGPFCSLPPILLDAAVDAGEVVICGPGNGADSEGECLSASNCMKEIGSYACPRGTVCCAQTECLGAGRICSGAVECCNGLTCAGPLGQEGVPMCGGNDLGGTDTAASGEDAGSGHAAVDQEATSSSTGCSISGDAGAGSFWAVGLVVAAVARRRRR